jgi:hypothetical protein
MKDDRSVKVDPSIENEGTRANAILEMEQFEAKPEQTSTRREPREFQHKDSSSTRRMSRKLKHEDRLKDDSSVVAVLTI